MRRSCPIKQTVIFGLCIASIATSAQAEAPGVRLPLGKLLQDGPGNVRADLNLDSNHLDAGLLTTHFLHPVSHQEEANLLGQWLHSDPTRSEPPTPEELRYFLAPPTSDNHHTPAQNVSFNHQDDVELIPFGSEQAVDDQMEEDDQIETELAEETVDVEEVPLGRARRFDEEQGSDEPDSDDDDDDTERKEATLEHFHRLTKPLTEIALAARDRDLDAPVSKAALLDRRDPADMITSESFGPLLPDRYTAGFMHRPLYYEQRNLERCGHSFRYLQNVVSGFQFIGNTIVLPYHMCAQRSCCLVPAGGDCKTCQKYPLDCNLFPLNHRALAVEAAALSGFSLLLL